MSFDQLGLAPEFLRAVSDQGYTEPTPIQTEAIPLVLDGRDIMAGAQTGTGKTAAFVLPMLQRLGRPSDHPGGHPNRRHPSAARRRIRALVLAPTRELALQVEESVRLYGRHWGLRSTAIYGGVGYGPQVNALRNGPDVVVATPGRLLDHVSQRTIDLAGVEILVLDEADRMLDMGFIRDIRRVLEVLPSHRQNLLFSATFSDEIRQLAAGFLHDPASIQVTPRNSAARLVTQVVHPVDRERKRQLLSRLIRDGVIDQALVFTRTKHGANRLAEQLGRDGIGAVAIHGNKSQPQRMRALADFKSGRSPILVATEIAARGLDIDGLPHVVNFELPMVPEDYVHRIGRTGRAGVTGHAVSLVCVDEAKLLRDIERVLGAPIPTEIVDGFAPDRSIRPEPILRGGPGRSRPGPSAEPRTHGDRHHGTRVGHGHAARVGHGHARQAQQGHAAQRQHGPATQAQQGHAAQRQHGPATQAQQGNRQATRPAPQRPVGQGRRWPTDDTGRRRPSHPGRARSSHPGRPGLGHRSSDRRSGPHPVRPQTMPGERLARAE